MNIRGHYTHWTTLHTFTQRGLIYTKNKVVFAKCVTHSFMSSESSDYSSVCKLI
jgi:hypothetical protein